MKNSLKLEDIVKFLWRKKTTIIVTAISVFTLSITYAIYINNKSAQIETEESVMEDFDVDEILSKPPEERTNKEEAFLDNYKMKDRYYFRVYIENEDSTVMSNSEFLKEVILQENFLKMVEDRVPIRDRTMLEEFIHVYFNTDSTIYVIAFRSGDGEYNRELSEAFYDVMNTEDIKILGNRSIHFFAGPTYVENENDAETEAAFVETTEDDTRLNLVLVSLVSLFFGIIMGVFIAVVLSVLGKKIDTFYNYELSKNDQLFNLSRYKRNDSFSESLTHLVLYPLDEKRVVLVDSQLLDNVERIISTETNNQIHLLSDFSQLGLAEKLDEAMVIIEIGTTEKEWFEKQKRQLQTNNIPIKVIGL